MIIFREKEFSLKDDITAGLITGSSIGIGASGLSKALTALGVYQVGSDSRAKKILDNPMASSITGALIGASLATAYFLTKKGASQARKLTNDKRNIVKDIRSTLVKFGFKEGSDFTFDPKTSNILKTRVCIVISRTSDELSLNINTVNDSKLDSISNQIIKTLPNTSVITRKTSDKFNELIISSISSNSGDAGFISITAEKFIKRGYPVFIVEVG